jgi:hypothetical protein
LKVLLVLGVKGGEVGVMAGNGSSSNSTAGVGEQ